MLTAYDATFARLVEESGAELILVGDSLGMVVQGRANTLAVSLDHMVYHTSCVSAVSRRSLVVGDMPFRSFHISPEETIRNAGRLVAEGGCDAVKLEGRRAPMVRALVGAEIAVMGHLGLTPQSVHLLGGFLVQGREVPQRQQILDGARELEDAGCFALVLECIPFDLAGEITEMLDIPTIGIGAGPLCRGQVLVTYDLLGMGTGQLPRFVPENQEGCSVQERLKRFVDDVRQRRFPSAQHCYGLNSANAALLPGDSRLAPPMEAVRS